MSKGTGRKTPKRNAKGHFVKGSGSSKRTASKRRNPAPARATPARTNPARRKTTRRRNPDTLLSRAASAYQAAGGIVLGGVAAEQAKSFIDKVMPGSASQPSVALSLVSASVPGMAGVLLMGLDGGDFWRNVGLGMVATSTANTVGVLIDTFTGDTPATTATASQGAVTQGESVSKGRGLLGPPARRLAAPASYGTGMAAGCGCHAGAPVGVAGNGF